MAELGTRRSTSFLLFLFLIGVMAMLIISVQSLYSAYVSYQRGLFEQANYQLILGIIGITTSIYITMQFRRRTALTPLTGFDLISTVKCDKCGFKNIRRFEKGDYIFKPVENCQQCNEQMVITSIYYEEKKKQRLSISQIVNTTQPSSSTTTVCSA